MYPLHAEQSAEKEARTDLEQGIGALRDGQIAAASEQFKAAIGQDPTLSEAYVYLGIAENQLERYADAVLAFGDALKLNDSSEAAHYNLALSLLGLQRFDSAAREFRVVLKLDPRNELANYNLALLLAEQGSLKEACKYLEIARSIQPGDQAIWVHLTDLYLRTGNDAAVLDVIRDAAVVDPDGTVSMQLGKLLVERNRCKEAVPLLEKAQKILPRTVPITGYLARAYLGAGQPERVIELLASIGDAEASWEVYDLRGLAATAMGQREEASQAFSSAIERQPGEASLHYHLGQLLLASNDKRGRTLGVHEISEAIRLDPGQSEYYLTLAGHYFDTRNLQATLDLLTSALHCVPPSVQIYITLGLAELELHGPAQAEPFIGRAIALNPQAGASYDLLGRCRMRLDDYAGAAEYYRKAAKLTPENDIYFRDAAIAFDRLGNSAEGLPFAERSVRLRPDQVYNHYILGKLYSQVGRRTDAIRELKQCITLNPQNSLPYNLLAGLYKRAGEDVKAANCWRSLRELKQQGAEQEEQTFSRLGSVPQ